ncbi:MAG: hypothetical protein U1C49_00520 [Candidatus Andersenbacteria bacterium]|nr:hypothetical protein [bacterium]MDZ4225309.1 hypothetical protein [Candidatus Andersenbacteria bacterium]
MRRYFALILMVALFLGFLTMNTFAANIPDKLKEAVLYLGCGEATGPGKIVKVNLKGKKLGEISLEAEPGSLCASLGNIYVSLPSDGSKKMGPGKVLKLDSEGGIISSFADGKMFFRPVSITASDYPPAWFVVCNRLDHVVRVAYDEEPEVVFTTEPPSVFSQNYSLATTGKLLLVATDDPEPGVRAVDLTAKDGKYPVKKLLPFDGVVAAQRNSDRWVATQIPMRRLPVVSVGRYVPLPDEPVYLHVFNGTQEIKKIPCPKSKGWYCRYTKKPWEPHSYWGWGPISFCGDRLVIAIMEKQGKSLYLADLDSGQFQFLFHWKQGRLVSLAATP